MVPAGALILRNLWLATRVTFEFKIRVTFNVKFKNPSFPTTSNWFTAPHFQNLSQKSLGLNLIAENWDTLERTLWDTQEHTLRVTKEYTFWET